MESKQLLLFVFARQDTRMCIDLFVSDLNVPLNYHLGDILSKERKILNLHVQCLLIIICVFFFKIKTVQFIAIPCKLITNKVRSLYMIYFNIQDK